MRTAIRFLTGLIIGAILGGLVGLLIAPTTGNALREKIENYFIETSNEIRIAAKQKREELEKELAVLRSAKSS
jgi:gas vesicle protein